MQKLFFLLVSVGLFFGCKKKQDIVLSSKNLIVSFKFLKSVNPSLDIDYDGVITNDSIKIGLKNGISLAGLKPTIIINGISVIPNNLESQNFTVPLKYTVTAENGNKKEYAVVAYNYNGNKSITSFIFKPSGNPGLTADAIGEIRNDSIFVLVSPDANIAALTPTIIFVGASISPSPLNATYFDFTNPRKFDVYADDGSSKTYTVVASTNALVYIGSKDGNMYAINAGNGTLKWKYQTSGSISSTPTIFNNTVYFGSDDKSFYAVDAVTGTLKWKYATAGMVRTAPCYFNGSLYFASGETYLNSAIYCLSSTTGSLVWKTQISYYYGSPTCYGNYMYIPDFTIGIKSYNASTGSFDKNCPVSLVSTNPTIANNTIYTGDESNEMVAYNIAGSNFFWKKQYANGIGRCPTYNNGSLYYSNADSLVSVQAATGTVNWKRALYYDISAAALSHCVFYNGNIFSVGGQENLSNNPATYTYLYSVNASTGAFNWRFPNASTGITGYGKSRSGPAIGNNIAYVSLGNQGLFAINATTGNIIWQFITSASNEFTSSPCLIDAKGKVFHAAASGEEN